MLVVTSPAKKIDTRSVDVPEQTSPDFQSDADVLAGLARDLSVSELRDLMKISEPLARLNAERFHNFGALPKKPAALAFAGDTYQGLEAASLDAEERIWAQDHLRILSGLYGLLRPFDAIEPYRLEMGSALRSERGRSLYEFWGDRLSLALNSQAQRIGTKILVNCASREYFGAVDRKALRLRVITPVFMEDRGGTPAIISFYAKRARGAMARFIIQHRSTDPEAIKDFETGGYRYRADLSDGDDWVFLRDYPEAA